MKFVRFVWQALWVVPAYVLLVLLCLVVLMAAGARAALGVWERNN